MENIFQKVWEVLSGGSLKEVFEKLLPPCHLCLVYENEKQWEKSILFFIKEGFKRKEKCIYIADIHTQEKVRKLLERENIPAGKLEKLGQLIISHSSEVYTKEGRFDPDRMIEFLKKEEKKALSQGYPALRVTGEMSWVLKGEPGSEKILEYEAKLNRDFFPKSRCIALCQYHRKDFPPDIIKGIILTHPFILWKGYLYPNFYYLPPEDFLGEGRLDREIDCLFGAIRRQEAYRRRLRRSEKIYAALVENAAEGIVVIQDGKIKFANKKFLDISGYSIKELSSKHFIQFVYPDDRELVLKNYTERIKGEEVPAFSFRLVDKKGRLIWVEVNATFIKWKGKTATLNFLTDITERKIIEKELEKKKIELEVLIDNIPDVIYFKDEKKRNVVVNKAYERLVGLEKEKIIGKTDREVLPPEFAFECERSDRETLKRKTINRFEEKMLSKEGRKIIFDTIKCPIFDDEGNIRGIVGVSRDITEKKKTEEKLSRLYLLQKTARMANQVIIKAKNEKELWEDICDIFVKEV
ncbi:PAS domain S-box protein, partial [Candidatus Aerophobetes bacterium]|nr:PAS domain S-box protein [Candidatus Aerophobetes bacterium]